MLWRLPTIFLALLLPLVLGAEDFYKLLQVDKSASEKDIKKAYRSLSKKFHPDKNPGDDGAHQKFVAIAEAYEALSNSETRRIYDQYGHEGLAQHKQGGGQRAHDPFDLFSRFFGGGGHFGGGGQRRGPDMEVRVNVPLKDFYNGNEHEFSVEKQQICEECEGTGSADGHVETCSQCGGRGMVVQKHMLAPGIFQQVQMGCDKCGGQGKTIKKPCKVCGGSRVVRKVSSYTLSVDRGAPRGSRIVYENEADASPDHVAGDLTVQLDELDPAIGTSDEERVDGTFFRRKGTEMFWKEVLSLREAWMGDWTRNLTHLDGHTVRLHRERGETVQPNTVEVVEGEGMPLTFEEKEHTGKEFGSLHVEYVVVLPDQLEKPMEKDFWALWEKWRKKKGVDLHKDTGRPVSVKRDEL
ncbi:DnaJ- protein scj1 [Thelotrema lepadinum]|nr:DnaJ- protein scj1 [Thelotrema lepadinum]